MAFKRKSKTMSILLTLAMLFMLWPGAVLAEDPGNVHVTTEIQLRDTVADAVYGVTGTVAEEVYAVTGTVTTPSKPQNFTATPGPGNGQVMLAWEPPASNGGSPITLYYFSRDGENWDGMTPDTFFTVTELTPGTEYTFLLKAFNGTVLGEMATATATALSGLPTGVYRVSSSDSQYDTLNAAVAAAATTDTIMLQDSFTDTVPVRVNSKAITLDLNGKALTLNTIATSNSTALTVINSGSVSLKNDSGGLHVIGHPNGGGVNVNTGGSATVTSATGGYGVKAYESGNIIVQQNSTATGMTGIAAEAQEGGQVTVKGSALAYEGTSKGVYATDPNTKVTVEGNVHGRQYGVHADNSAEVIVKGNVSTDAKGDTFGRGLWAENKAKIQVDGNVSTNDHSGSIGAYAHSTSAGSPTEITVNGTISSLTYIKLNDKHMVNGPAYRTTPSTKVGYHTYTLTDTAGTHTVWVKDTAASDIPLRIAAGSGHSLFLKEDGTIWAWGSNFYGQLGRGMFTDYSFETPAQVQGITGVSSIDAGAVFSLALKEDGTVWAWGTNGNGQLGLPLGSPYKSHTPTQVAGLSGIRAISAGHRFCLALDANGDVWAWGANEKGQLGQAAIESVPSPAKITALSNIVAISAGYENSLALDADGKVWSWGSNYFGELGNGTADATSANPIQVSVPAGLVVNGIYAGFQNSMLFTDTGAVYGWGYNSLGSLGDGTNSNKSAPTLTLYSDITALGGTGDFFIARKNDGTVWASGKNSFGSNMIDYTADTKQVNGLTGITAVSQGNGGNHSLALDANGDVWAWGTNTSKQCGVATDYYGEPKKIDPPVKVQFSGGSPTVTGVTVTPTTTSVQKGASQSFMATVNGTNSPDQSVTWSVNSTSGSIISTLGLLNVAAGETAATLTVTATSTVDHTKSGTATVTIIESADPDIAIVNNAKTAAENATYSNMTQAAASSENAIKTPLRNIAVSAVNNGSVNVAVNTVSYTPPVAGTSADPSGTNGSYTFTITVSKGTQSQTTTQKTITITATAYTSPSSGGGGSSSSTPSGILVTPDGKDASDSGVALSFPAGAVESDIRVQVREASLTSGMDLPEDSQLISQVVNIIKDKSGDFSEPVTITMSFNKSQIDPDKYDIKICYFDEENGEWVELDNIEVDLTKSTVSGEVTHFTKFAVIATLKEVEPEVTPQPPVPPAAKLPADIIGHWAKDSIAKLVQAGIVSGYPDGTFQPDKTVTRAEFTVMLVKALKLESKSGTVFADSTNHWAKDSISTAAAHGIISGYDQNSFGPDDNITREQAAVIIARAAKLQAEDQKLSFSDAQQISPWALSSVTAAVSQSYLSGYPDNSFRPQGNTTRAEAATIIAKLL